MMFGTIEQALEDLKAGKFLVVADDEDRENEGDLICAAEFITPQMVNFLMHAKGMICVALTPERVRELGLAMMGDENTDALRTAYTVTVDGAPRHGVTTGISASDQATTIRLTALPSSQPSDLRRPGHVHPLRAREGGVLPGVPVVFGGVSVFRAGHSDLHDDCLPWLHASHSTKPTGTAVSSGSLGAGQSCAMSTACQSSLPLACCIPVPSVRGHQRGYLPVA